MATETTARDRKSYSSSELILGNAAIILWIGLGALSCWIFFPLAAIVFIVIAAFLVFYEIGKHGCVTCYYCKTCTIGMGKLPELFFRKAGTANVNLKAMKVFPIAYLMLSALPIALVLVSFLQGITVFKIALFFGILTFSVYTGITRWNTLSRHSVKSNPMDSR